jgi:solute carrier family 35 protein E1
MIITMRTSAIVIIATCLFVSLSHGTNALVVQPPSVSGISVKPAVPSLLGVTNKRLARRGVMIQPAQYEAANMDVYPFDRESSELSATDEPVASDWKRTIKLTMLFSLWYVLNIGYSIGNKHVLNALPIPLTAAAVELSFGFPYVALLWTTGLRKRPKLSFDKVKTLCSQASLLVVTHVLGIISFGTGAISFPHIIKSKEALNSRPLGENLTPANMFAVLTILGFLFILPLSLLVEGPAKVSAAWTSALARGYTNSQLFRLLSVSGFMYYVYNELAFLAISEVGPVTPNVGSTVKLVTIILFCSILPRPSQQAQIGGAMVYSIGLRSYGEVPV